MKNPMAANFPLAIVLFAAVAAVALRAAARRQESPQAPGTGLEPVVVMAGQAQSQPRHPATAGTHDRTGGETPRPPAPPGRLAADQMQHIFHELHADMPHALCGVCDGQYGSA